MLRARLLTAAVAIPLLLLLIKFAPPWLFASVIGLIAAVGVLEYFAMAFPSQTGSRLLGIGLGWLLVICAASMRPEWTAFGVAAVLIAGLTWTLLVRSDFDKGLADLGITLLGTSYVGLLMPYFIWLWRTPDGPAWVLFLLGAAMGGDSGGYFAGRAFGAHKLMPSVSPGKTVEGSIGILLGNVVGVGIAIFLLLPLMGLRLPQLGWGEAVAIALMIGTLGQLGDLCESMMKRTFAAKESGWIFPGHGGVLDRIDSLVFPVTLLYYYVTLHR